MGFPVALKYLEDRGIPPEFALELGIRVCLANELFETVLRKKSYDDRLALLIPHHDISGNYYGWWSARLVAMPKAERAHRAGRFDVVEGVDKRGKMFCPPGEPPLAYLPPTLDWTALKKGDKVYIHESAIKAANGARLLRYSVGLNGVRGWSALKHGHALVEGLRDIPWRAAELEPIIVFDSNTADNPDVQDARIRLAAKLLELTGRTARTLNIPCREDGTHRGFDDFCMDVGDQAAIDFLEQEPEAIPLGDYEQMLHDLNTKVVLVRNISRIVEIETGTHMTRQTFSDVNYADYIIQTDDDRWVNFPKLWMQTPRRRVVERLEYSPGQPKVTKDFLNLWNGMGVEPQTGDVSEWLRVLERGVPDEPLRKWIIQWLAYPLQNLGAKLNQYVLLYGPSGTGKNALLVPLQRIYGDNYATVGRERIASDFNEIYAQRQFVNVDELHGGTERDAVAIANKIKMLTTAPDLVINGKGKAEYTVTNHVNLALTANYSDAIKLDDGDRRACVVRFGQAEEVIRDREYWTRYHDWAMSDEGAAALYDYLLNVDCTGYDPKGWAPDTEWKKQVTESTKGAMEKWVEDLWTDPDSVLPVFMRGASVLTPEQVAIAYMPEETHKITPGLKNALGQRMQDRGFARLSVKIDGVAKRLWIVQDRKGDWSPARVRKEYAMAQNMAKGKF